ncbi:MAG: FHA domain-containing protein, partial [Bdellovibrionales bacterium]
MKALFPWVSNCMWILRFLNGPLAGQVLPLKKSPIVLGRAPNCDIKIPSGSVSKEHTRLELFDDKLIVSDMGSRNGTFVNGVQVRSSKVRPGDKINMHDILFEVQKMPDTWAAHMHAPFPGYGPASRSPGYSYGAAAVQSHPTSGYAPRADAEMNADLASDGFPRWATLGREYMDRVVLPGVYHLPKIFEFRWVLAGFMAAFILLVTTLSTIPLIRILKQSIEETSQQHALTIATTLARVNRPFLISGQESASSVEIATSRPGVSRAYLISNIDGNIVAPAAQAGSFPDLPYVHEGRKRSQDSVKQVDDNTVIAMVPVMVFNQDTGQQAVTHWAVIQYDMSALAVDNAQILSLFISTLFIALLLGGMLFYFLYKVVEYPIRSMNLQLDVALKEGHETVSTD